MTIDVMSNQDTKKICVVASEDDGVMAHTVFEMDISLEDAEKLHTKLGKAIKRFKD